MKLEYYAETDSLYITLRDVGAFETREIAEGVNIDFDTDGNIVGVDIDHASKKLDMSTLEAGTLPLGAAYCG